MNEKFARLKAKIQQHTPEIIVVAGIVIATATLTLITKNLLDKKAREFDRKGCELLQDILDDFADGKPKKAWLESGALYIDELSEN